MGVNPADQYTPGEMKALIAPLLGIQPEELETVYIMAVSRDHQLAVQSNISDVYHRLRMLTAVLEYETHVHLTYAEPDLCECAIAPGPHPRTEDCPDEPPEPLV